MGFNIHHCIGHGFYSNTYDNSPGFNKLCVIAMVGCFHHFTHTDRILQILYHLTYIPTAAPGWGAS